MTPHKTPDRLVDLRMIIIITIGFVFTFPAFTSGFLSGHNVLTHLVWSTEFTKQLWAGDLYPRWLMNMNAGYGSPAFFYYFPLPYYATSFFYALTSASEPHGWLQIGLSAGTALALSGLTAYLWLQGLAGKNAALLGAIVYMLMPYHLLVDLYSRFAFTEFWAFVWLPLVLYFVDRIHLLRPKYLFGLSISYGCLITTHLPTTLIFSPIILIYSLFISNGSSTRTENFFQTALGLLLGIGLSAIYLFPALNYTHLVRINEMSTGNYYYGSNFIFSGINKQPNISNNYFILVSSVIFSTFIASIFSYLSIRKTDNKTKIHGSFWITVAIGATVMTTYFSNPIWTFFPILQKIQFPYRFGTILTLAAAPIFALAFEHGSKHFATHARLGRATGMMIFISLSVVTAQTVYKRATGLWDMQTQQTISRELSLLMEVDEYRPVWAGDELFVAIATSKPMLRAPLFRVDGDPVSVDIQEWQPPRIRLKTEAATPSRLQLRQLYFPGWVAHLKDKSDRRLQVEPSWPEGLLSLNIPQGHHEIELTLEPGRAERIGQATTAASALILLLPLFFRRQPNWCHRVKN